MSLYDYDVVGYMYQAENWCTWHIEDALDEHGNRGEALDDLLDDLAKARGIDRTHEESFDSDDFPKVVFRYQALDSNATCAACGEELAA